MIRILLFLIVVFALGLGFAWLADRPGDMVVTFEPANGLSSAIATVEPGASAGALVRATSISDSAPCLRTSSFTGVSNSAVASR